MGKAYGINFPNNAANRYFMTMCEVFPRDKALEEYKKWCTKLDLEHGVTEIVAKEPKGEILEATFVEEVR